MNVFLIRFFMVLFILISPVLRAQDNTTVIKKVTNKKIDSLLVAAVAALESADYQSSTESLLLAKDLAKSIKKKDRIGDTSYTLALLFFQAKDYTKATSENEQAIAYQTESKDSKGLGQSYLLAAQIHMKQNEYGKAKDYLDQAGSLIQRENLQFLKGKLHLNKGNIALTSNQIDSAIDHYTQAINAPSDQQDFYLSADINTQKAKALVKAKRFDEAKAALTIAEDLSAQNDYPIIALEAKKISSDIAFAQNNYQKAYNDLKSYREGLTKYLNSEKSNLNDRIDEVSKAELTSQLDNDILKRSLEVTTLVTVLSIALVTILSLLILSLYKNNNLRAKANELLQSKNTELIIAKENAEKASMVKAQFLSTITHELRTPMYAVTGLTHLLLSENPTAEQKKHLDSLKFSGEYLLSLINNILDLNKLEANKVDLEETSFNLRKRIEDVLFALEKSAKDKGNKLHFEFDEDIPAELLGDPLVISQILINLVGNAVKFTRDGEVYIRVQKISQSDADIDLHFEIQDTGEGISKKKQKSIFQNFTQGSVAINRKFGGTGLGLSIVKNLLDLLNSKISLESTLGKGSVFKFDIKYNLAKSLTDNENPHNIIYDVDYVALENRHILVVEDNKINQMITRKILEKNKIICDVADNGEIAVEKVRSSKFDLILMDIHMPGISGIEATEQIRVFDEDIPILALTAVTIDENVDDFYVAGFNDIIPKPYKVEEFFQKIHNALKKSNVIKM